MEIMWPGLLTVVIIPIIAQKDNSGETFWRHSRTTHKPLYGSPDIAEWYIDSDESSDDNYYNFYHGDETNFEKDNQVVRNNKDTNKDSNAIQNDSPYGFGGNPDKASDIGGLSYSYDSSVDKESGFVGYQSNNIRQTDIEHCVDELHVKYYCRKIKNGLYFDPWNPWCGYISCVDEQAIRHVCSQGTWMGATAMKFSGKQMCRRQLSNSVTITVGNACPAPTDYDMCRNARTIELEQESS